jgi:hypothetical protein
MTLRYDERDTVRLDLAYNVIRRALNTGILSGVGDNNALGDFWLFVGDIARDE